MTDYNDPTTALLDLDWLLDQASLFITANAVECELEARLPHRGLHDIAAIRAEVKRFLTHESVEEIYDQYLDRMGKLELACRKAEVARSLNRLMAGVLSFQTRQAA